MTSTQTMTTTTTKTDHYHYLRAMVVLLAAALAMMAAMLLMASRPAHAQTTFTVNNNVDPGDGVCDAQECTLREAMNAANLTPNSGDPDLIRFKIPGPGVMPTTRRACWISSPTMR